MEIERQELNKFKAHPIYDRYLANKDGIIINIKIKKPLKQRIVRSYLSIGFKLNKKNKNCCETALFPNSFLIIYTSC